MSRAALRVAVVGSALVAAAGCGPCDGVVACTVSSRLAYSGQIVDRDKGGAPVAGVAVQILQTGGVELASRSAGVATDANGWWTIEVSATADGLVSADIVVKPPSGVGYTVRGTAARAVSVRGQGTVVGTWTAHPFISTIGVLQDAATGKPIGGARVTAVRRGGAQVFPTSATQSPMVTNGAGYFLYDVKPSSDSAVTVDLVIARDSLPTATISGVVITPTYEWAAPHVAGDLIFAIDTAGTVRRVPTSLRASSGR